MAGLTHTEEKLRCINFFSVPSSRVSFEGSFDTHKKEKNKSKQPFKINSTRQTWQVLVERQSNPWLSQMVENFQID
jgi:hypothetical protein